MQGGEGGGKLGGEGGGKLGGEERKEETVEERFLAEYSGRVSETSIVMPGHDDSSDTGDNSEDDSSTAEDGSKVGYISGWILFKWVRVWGTLTRSPTGAI